MIPFLDLASLNQNIEEELTQACSRVIISGEYILGKEVEQFENEFAGLCNAKYCVSVGSGLDALVLSLLALGIGEGDEVIVPANTFIATWLAVSHSGARPVAVDCTDVDYNINIDSIYKAITPKTKAIIPVHLYGHPSNLEAIHTIAADAGIKVIEDAAQAHCSTYRGTPIGHHSDAVAWSFYPGKNLGAIGDGGAITTNSLEIAESIKLLRNYGSCVKYRHEIKGYNSRLDTMQAAMLRVKLKYLTAWASRRNEIAKRYAEELQQTPLILPKVDINVEHAWHLYVVLYKDRDKLQHYLTERDVVTIIHYPVPPHLQPAYAELNYSIGDFPVSEKLASECISLPLGPCLSDEQQTIVIEALCDYFS